MTIRTPHRRQAAARLSATAAVVSAFMLLLSTWSVLVAPAAKVAADPVPGTAAVVDPENVPLASGSSTTPFKLQLPGGSACSGDSANSGYRVQSYVVPVGTDPAGLTFNSSSGPQPNGTDPFIQPVFFATGSPYLDQLTDLQTEPGGPGGVAVPLDPFDFKVFLDEGIAIPSGTYNIGIACSNPTPPAPATVDRFWNAVIEITADGAVPNGISWEVTDAPPPETTTTIDGETTTTVDGETTTTVDGETTTTVDGETTTTVDGETTTTFDTGGGSGATSPTTFGAGSPSGPAVASTVGQLPYTGNSPWNLVIWGALMLVFGRMAMLLSRKPKARA